MYNGIGLVSVRGTGTSGYIQGNKFDLKGPPKTQKGDLSREIRDHGSSQKGPNADFLEHQRKRDMEVKIEELRDQLEDEGLSDDEIEQRLTRYREKLTEDNGGRAGIESEGVRGDAARPLEQETHQIAMRKQQQMERLRQALDLPENAKEGEAFDRELQQQKKMLRQAEREEAKRRMEEEASRRGKEDRKRKRHEAEKHHRSEAQMLQERGDDGGHRQLESSIRDEKAHNDKTEKVDRERKRSQERSIDTSEEEQSRGRSVDRTGRERSRRRNTGSSLSRSSLSGGSPSRGGGARERRLSRRRRRSVSTSSSSYITTTTTTTSASVSYSTSSYTSTSSYSSGRSKSRSSRTTSSTGSSSYTASSPSERDETDSRRSRGRRRSRSRSRDARAYVSSKRR